MDDRRQAVLDRRPDERCQSAHASQEAGLAGQLDVALVLPRLRCEHVAAVLVGDHVVQVLRTWSDRRVRRRSGRRRADWAPGSARPGSMPGRGWRSASAAARGAGRCCTACRSGGAPRTAARDRCPPARVRTARWRRSAAASRSPDRCAEAEPVVDDPGDLRPVLGHLGLAFDHRGDDQRLVRRDAECRGAVDDVLLIADAFHQCDHPLDDLALRLGVRHLVGVGEQQPLERCRRRAAGTTSGSCRLVAAARNSAALSAVDRCLRGARPSSTP